jgi:[protein-PII] uridylyltransferase
MPSDEDSFAAYAASMPSGYRSAFSADDQRAHEAIVRRRGDRATHVEIWRELPDHVVAICVVADDSPGLLSCISAGLVDTDIDVVGADAYCRRRKNRRIEAVDFLWIRRIPNAAGVVPPIRARDIAAIARAIEEAAGPGERARRDSVASQRVPSVSLAAARPRPEERAPIARIRFDNDPRDGTTILTVEAVDRPGLLLAVTQVLFRAGLQIVGLRATTERGAAVDRFHIAEVDGAPLRQERLLELQAEILGAIDEGTQPASQRSA